MAIPTVTERDFEQNVLLSELPVLVQFTAEWCGPCKTVAPEVEALSHELEGKAKIVKVDIDKSQLIARQMRVQSVPAFAVFHQGRPTGYPVVGALKRSQLRELLEPYLPRAEGALKPEEIAQLLQAGRITLVDIREPAVYARAHLPRAVNIPGDEIESRLAELHMLPAPPVVYCRSGELTKDLTVRLAEQGVPVAFLEGGVLAWEAAGFPIERPD